MQDFDNAEVKYHIGITLHAISRKVEAKKHLIEAIDSEQSFPEKKPPVPFKEMVELKRIAF